MVWLDLENTYGSVPYQLISLALDFFHVLMFVKNIIESYYVDVKICSLLQDYTTDWQELGRGTAMGCAISPILFTATFEVILIGMRTMAKEVCNSNNICHPFVTSWMMSQAYCRQLLGSLRTAFLGQNENKAC